MRAIAAMLTSYLMVNGAQFYQQYVVAKWTEVGSSAISSALDGISIPVDKKSSPSSAKLPESYFFLNHLSI